VDPLDWEDEPVPVPLKGTLTRDFHLYFF